MSDKNHSETGKLFIDLLVGFERLQYASCFDKSDNPNAIYMLYSSMMKLINRVVHPEQRDARIFRLKYHHILSNESVDEYLFHCLSKILSDLLEIENNYQRFIQPVADLHMKLMSILTKIHSEQEKIVLTNRRVVHEIHKRQEKYELNHEESESTHEGANKFLKPVFFLPAKCSIKRLKKNQSLTFQAIHSHYGASSFIDNDMLDMLIDFDTAFADFELDFVCQVNNNSIFSSHRAELTMNVAAMFSDAVQWASGANFIQYKSIGNCDIEIMVGIPRLAVLYGCRIINDGPLSEWSLNCHNDIEIEERLAPVFQDHRQDLCRLRRQLNVLNSVELDYLSQLLLDHNDLSPFEADQSKPPYKKRHASQTVSGDMHALFKLVSSVSDQMQTKHASDYRFFMETIFKLYKDEPDISCSPTTSSFNSNTWSNSDMFQSQYLNVFSYFSIDEAVDALTFSIADQFPIDNCLDLSLIFPRDEKDLSISQVSCVRQNTPVQPVDVFMPLCRPQWRSDSFFPRCCHCDRKFNVFLRRHHCRRCGYLFCSYCWGTKIALPALGIQNKVSICVECEEFLHGKGLVPTVIGSTQGTS